MKPLVRWTIGPATKAGHECLLLSTASFLSLYDADVVICHNCPREDLAYLPDNFRFVDQAEIAAQSAIPPAGVAWKLYPPRLDQERHEICIDNDIIFEEPIPEITEFLSGDCTLLLQGDSRTYGRFENHVPVGYEINSGIYGMPAGFDLHRYVSFYCNKDWEMNALGEHKESKTFDEQGLVALALLNYQKYVIIPSTSVTKCEHQLVMAKGMHFIGLNRRAYHHPFALYRSQKTKMYL